MSKLEERTSGRYRLILLDQGGAARLRGTTPWTVVLTYTKGGLSYKVVLVNRDYVVLEVEIIEDATGTFYGPPW